MKATRKLIPAIAMLLISAVMMSTATFAWFSTNATVTATGMQISAASENTYVVILEGTGTNKDTPPALTAFNSTHTTVNAGMTNATALFPAFATAKADNSGFDWITGKSSNAAVSTPTGGEEGNGTTTETDIVGTLEDVYAVKKTFYVTVLDGFVNADNLVLSGIKVTGASVFDDAVSIAILATDGSASSTKAAYVYLNQTPSDANILDTELVVGELTKLEVWIFINGRNDTVTSANSVLDGALEGMNVELTFTTGD